MIKGVKIFFLIALVLVVTIIALSCSKEPIKIGFIGSLTSKQSQLSIDARNAIQLRIDAINESGGINGRTIELIVKDDQASYEVSLKKYQEFIDEGVHFIIGPMTSNMVEAVLDAPKEELLFISPSMSTNELLGKDDNFLRTCPLIDGQRKIFLKQLSDEDYDKITIIYDLMNKNYTEYLARSIQIYNEGIIDEIELISFDSRKGNVKSTVEDIDLKGSDAVLMISQSVDTAIMSQQIRKESLDIKLYSVSWSMTQDLIEFGGEAINGMELIGIYKSQVKSETLKKFEYDFLKRYNYDVSFIAKMAYDTFDVLIEGIKASDSLEPESVKKTILEIGKFKGLEDPIVMDIYGDSERSYLIYKVMNGAFVPIYE